MPSYMRNNNYRSSCGCGRYAAVRNLTAAVIFDEANSVLNPACGEKQRFCYQINGADSTGNVYVPMEYVIIGLGNTLSMDDFCNIQVAINGVFQQVEWGVNVQIVCNSCPDCATGCTGLKLMFPLNNATDMMHVCLTMKKVFTVGMVGACLNANGTAITGIDVPGPKQVYCECTEGNEGRRAAEYSCPRIAVGEAVVKPCGDPVITMNNQTDCGYLFTQKFSLSVPFAINMAQNERIGMTHSNNESNYSNGCSENSQGCSGIGYQTRIQDLIRDPMLWHK